MCGRTLVADILAPGETDVAAIHRRVREELGVEVTDVEVMLPDFGYTATDPHGLVENEYCPVYRAVIVDPAVMRPTRMR